MARYYNCKCGKQHPIGTECPNKYKYKKENSSEDNKKVNKFYSSKLWKSKREEIKSRDKGLCQRCLIKFGIVTTEHLHVHHIVPLMKSWEKRLENNNLITLCVQCHSYCENNGFDFDWIPPEKEFNFEFR